MQHVVQLIRIAHIGPRLLAQVREEAWPDVRDADELHDVLHTLVALPEAADSDEPSVFSLEKSGGEAQLWKAYFEQLDAQGRAALASVDGRRYWVAAERARSFSVLFPAAQFEQKLADVEIGEISHDEALLTLVMGWMAHIGPTTSSRLGDVLGLAGSDIENALLRMEAAGTVLRGRFRSEER